MLNVFERSQGEEITQFNTCFYCSTETDACSMIFSNIIVVVAMSQLLDFQESLLFPTLVVALVCGVGGGGVVVVVVVGGGGVGVVVVVVVVVVVGGGGGGGI